MSKIVKVNKGKQGWGGPLTLKATDELKYVVSVTGGGIHPVAKKNSRNDGNNCS